MLRFRLSLHDFVLAMTSLTFSVSSKSAPLARNVRKQDKLSLIVASLYLYLSIHAAYCTILPRTSGLAVAPASPIFCGFVTVKFFDLCEETHT